MNGWTRTIGGLRASAGRAESAGSRRGFTLVEVLISVGAVAIVSVGLAAIFQTIGATVTQGQKVSALTQAAAVLEQQMRRDFSGMTREGFLVIRNQFAGPRNGGGNWEVALNKDDVNARERRIDEMVFFAKGEFETARAPINPSLVARSDTGMVYYGHVLFPRHRPGNQADIRPSVSSINDPDPTRSTDTVPGRAELFAYAGGGSFGEALPGGGVLPNTFAENWTLGRKVTLLATPKSAREDLPARGWPRALRLAANGGAPNSRLSENEVQIASQPAASHIFRSLGRLVSVVAPGANARRDQLARPVTGPGGDPGSTFPQLSSGLVDIATTDLNEIRTIVQTFDLDPRDPNLLARYESLRYNDPAADPDATWNAKFRATDIDDLRRMHAWMQDAFPTQSDRYGPTSQTDPRAARMRAESAPPDYLNVLTDLSGRQGEDAVALLTRRADQSMLTQGAVLPRCTEFIVEWTFGLVNPNTGELLWYGSNTGASQITQYDESPRYSPFAGRTGLSGGATAHYARRELIYGSPIPPRTATQTAHFGFFDPYYNPPVNNGNLSDPYDPVVVPWAWPKLVRITVALTDEREPLKEERFQWVFELPGTPDPQ
jgi:prepilin-type N-terminal cleavage/methylation domain-containing protein